MKARGFRNRKEDLELITNKDLIAAVHSLMGGIDLDPASSKVANSYIEAQEYFSPQDDGLNVQEWYGRVYLFPPGGAYFFDKKQDRWKMSRGSSGSLTSSHALWFKKLHRLWLADVVTEAVFFTNCTDMIRYDQRIFDFPICILKTATSLIKNSSEGLGIQKTGTCLVVYLQNKTEPGESTQRFIDIYSERGRILC